MGNPKRYKCRKCNETFFENLPAKERRKLMRDRYVLLTRSKHLIDFGDQIKLQVWTKNFPLVRQAYELKSNSLTSMKPNQSTMLIKSIKIGFKMYLKN